MDLPPEKERPRPFLKEWKKCLCPGKSTERDLVLPNMSKDKSLPAPTGAGCCSWEGWMMAVTRMR